MLAAEPEFQHTTRIVLAADIHRRNPLCVPLVGSMRAAPIWGVVEIPTRAGVLKLTALAGLAMPALTGIVDLSLRARIP